MLALVGVTHEIPVCVCVCMCVCGGGVVPASQLQLQTRAVRHWSFQPLPPTTVVIDMAYAENVQ